MYKLDDLQKKKVADLKEIATKLNLKKFEKLAKTDLIYKILDEQAAVSSKETNEKPEVKPSPKQKRDRFTKKTTPVKTEEKKTENTEKVETKTNEKKETENKVPQNKTQNPNQNKKTNPNQEKKETEK